MSCQEQRQQEYISFIDITKVFDLVSRDGFFKILNMISYLLRLFKIVQSFHMDMKDVQFGDSYLNAFNSCSSVKHLPYLTSSSWSCWNEAFMASTKTDSIYLHIRIDVQFVLTESEIKSLWCSHYRPVVHRWFSTDSTIWRAMTNGQFFKSLPNVWSDHQTKMMGQGTELPPAIKINFDLEVVREFTYLSSTITYTLSLETKVNR